MIAPKLIESIKAEFPDFTCDIDDNGIAVFDGIFSPKMCDSLIKHFEDVDALGKTYNRIQGFKKLSHVTDDDAIDFTNFKFELNDELRVESSEFMNLFWNYIYKLYAEKFSVLSDLAQHRIHTVKLQRTKPGGGYHIWHCERGGRHYESRVMVFILYLNDIAEAGETEFLYLKKRVVPKQGRFLLWPSDYVHTHRGNPPLKENKYILTGWVEF